MAESRSAAPASGPAHGERRVSSGSRRATRARTVVARLAARYPGDAGELCALEHRDPYELLVSTILSAQCTDERVNLVTPALFRRYPTAAALAAADTAELEELVRPTGFFRAKSASLLGMARALVAEHAGEVPDDLEALVRLPGVGRKTANVVRSVAFDRPGLPVDTHVGRLARRLELSGETDPEKVERDLCELVPPAGWGALSLRLILLGREVCAARRPRCGECPLADVCPSAFVAPAPAPRRAGTPRRAPQARAARQR